MNASKEVLSVQRKPVALTRMDLTDATARLVSLEMALHVMILMSALHKDLLAAQGMQSALIHQDRTVATVKKASLGMVTHVLDLMHLVRPLSLPRCATLLCYWWLVCWNS